MALSPEERRQAFQRRVDRAARELVLAIAQLNERRAGSYAIELPARQDAKGIEWDLTWKWEPAPREEGQGT